MREDRLTLLPLASRRENVLWPDPHHARDMFQSKQASQALPLPQGRSSGDKGSSFSL